MAPGLIAGRARERGIDIVALTDHNSTLNCPAFAESCRRAGLAALFGAELTTREEVHVLCLFAELEAAVAFGEELWDLLPRIPNRPEKLGYQVVVDADEYVLGEVEYYLGSALPLSLDEVAALSSGMGALIVPAHIDRPMYSVGSQLGFLPDGPWAAVEAIKSPPGLDPRGYGVITGSDAHRPDELGVRACALDCGRSPLLPGGGVDLGALAAALAARKISASGPLISNPFPE
jgi:3',5'-nucleoside bisphosphate phosphatase